MALREIILLILYNKSNQAFINLKNYWNLELNL